VLEALTVALSDVDRNMWESAAQFIVKEFGAPKENQQLLNAVLRDRFIRDYLDKSRGQGATAGALRGAPLRRVQWPDVPLLERHRFRRLDLGRVFTSDNPGNEGQLAERIGLALAAVNCWDDHDSKTRRAATEELGRCLEITSPVIAAESSGSILEASRSVAIAPRSLGKPPPNGCRSMAVPHAGRSLATSWP
jgi:hypothetical protein